MRVALGIDLSLSATGLVAVPFDWGGDWSRVARATYGDKLKETASELAHAQRRAFIVRNLLAFARKFGCTHAFIEQYAFSRPKFGKSRAHLTGELGGKIKDAVMLELGIPLQPVVATQARSVLNKFPSKDGKTHCHLFLHNVMGCPIEWEPDECDAWVVANYGMSSLGGDALLLRDPSSEPKTKSKKKSGGRRAA